MSSRSSLIAVFLLATGATGAGAPAWASLVADGVTYTLLESPVSGTNGTEEQFTLEITGINGPADTEGGRYGVGSFALAEPGQPGSVTGGSLTGFTFMTGGLNSMGCNGKGNFFCFKAQTQPTPPALPANSELIFTFDVTAKSSGDWTGYNPDFKIQWLGTNNNYNLISQPLTPTVVPLPATLPLLLGGLAALGFTRRRRSA
jgi:hypothetical protein